MDHVVPAEDCQSPVRAVEADVPGAVRVDEDAARAVRLTGDAEDRARVLDLFPRLQERINQKAGTMSGGEQQMLAVARALLGDPQLLLNELIRLGPVYHFEVTKPSLHDIFVRIANPAAEELQEKLEVSE